MSVEVERVGQASRNGARAVHVWMYVLKDVPPSLDLLLTEMGFRKSKAGNWYRHYDNRLPGTATKRLAIEALAQSRSLTIAIKPMRATFVQRAAPKPPSATAWLRDNDKPSRLDRLRQVRKQSKRKRANRRPDAP